VVGDLPLEQIADLAAGMGSTPDAPHWMYSYLTDAMPVRQKMVRRTAYEQAIVAAGGTLVVPDVTNEAPNEGTTASEDEEIPGNKAAKAAARRRIDFTTRNGASKGQPTIEHDGVQLVRQDHRDSAKGEIWRAASALPDALVEVEAELRAGDGAPTLLASWIAVGSAGSVPVPAPMAEAAPEESAQLQSLTRRVFRAAQAMADTWRAETAQRMGESIDNAAVRAQVRRACNACAFEALKSVSSWVSLDRNAAEEKALRLRRRTEAIERHTSQGSVSASDVEDLLSAIADRSESLKRKDPNAIVLDLQGFDWRCAAAIRHYLDTRILAYPREERDPAPWSHPDWDGFWSAFGAHPALPVIVAPGIEDADGERSMAPSIAEITQTWARAQGSARYSATRRARIHVDWSSSGTRGTLATARDLEQQTRRRTDHHDAGVPVLNATAEWLGRSLSLQCHVAADRGIRLTAADTSWDVEYHRNIRHPEEGMTGSVKTFDLAIDPDAKTATITLPIQIPLDGFADNAHTKSLAVGGYYRVRSGADPSQPDGMKTVPPEQARVIGLDLGIGPVAGWALLERDGDTIRQVRTGHLGTLRDVALEEDRVRLWDPSLSLAEAAHLVRRAAKVRGWISAAARGTLERPARLDDKDGLVPESLRDPLVAAACANAAWTDACIRLIQAIPAAAIAPAPTSVTMKMGAVEVGGRRQSGVPISAQADQIVDGILARSTDPDAKEAMRLVLRPLAWVLIAYQRMRACRFAMGQMTLRTMRATEMTAARNEIAVQFGFVSEQDYYRVLGQRTEPLAFAARGDQHEDHVSITASLIVADLLEDLSSLGTALTGWGRTPLARGQAPAADDPRAIWAENYGHLRTLAASKRAEIHKLTAARAARLAAQEQAVLVVENLSMETTSRADTAANTLTRRMSARDWMQMVLRAADTRGVPVVLVDPSWTSHETVPVDEAGRCAEPVLTIEDGQIQPHRDRVTAAVAIAYRSISGWPTRTRYAVQLAEAGPSGERWARLAPAPGAGRKATFPVWASRMAKALAADSPLRLGWRIDPTAHTAVQGVIPDTVTWTAERGVLARTTDGLRLLTAKATKRRTAAAR
jgi:hypothetical protein